MGAVLYLSLKLGMTSPQVACVIDCSPVFVRQVLHRAAVIAEKMERNEPLHPHFKGKHITSVCAPGHGSVVRSMT